MQLVPLGDSALLVELGSKPDEATAERVRRLAAALSENRLAGVKAIVASFTAVAIHYDPIEVPGKPDEGAQTVAAWIERWKAKGPSKRTKPTEVTLPVCYGGEHGPDLEHVAETAKLSPAEVIRRHARATYEVRAVGFSPGFPYLAGLPPELGTPRRATPRTRVPAGSVAIGGAQTGVYPSSTPGGWNLIGRTPRALFDPHAKPPALVRTGDRVKFEAIKSEAFAQLVEAARPSEGARPDRTNPVLLVERPGAFTTVQDLGRPDQEEIGVPPGGAVDAVALRIANLLVGNEEGAAGLECTLTGPVLKFQAAARVAITGAKVEGLPWARPFNVKAGETLSLEAITAGCRAYLAIAGGIAVPLVLGSRSTLVGASFGGFGGRGLQAGDALNIEGKRRKGAQDAAGNWFVGSPLLAAGGDEAEIRVVPGVQKAWFKAEMWSAFLAGSYQVSARSDRMGARLEGPEIKLPAAREMTSEAVATGAVQIPPDGKPIVLLAERQTIGGYPKIAHVITVDFGRLAQLRPGAKVRFVETTIEEARRLRRRQDRDFVWLRAGLRDKQVHGAH